MAVGALYPVDPSCYPTEMDPDAAIDTAAAPPTVPEPAPDSPKSTASSEDTASCAADSDFEPEHKITRASLRSKTVSTSPRDRHFCRVAFSTSPAAFYAIVCNVAGNDCILLSSKPVREVRKGADRGPWKDSDAWVVYVQLSVPPKVFMDLVAARLSRKVAVEEVTDAKTQAQRMFFPASCFQDAKPAKAARATKRVKLAAEPAAAPAPPSSPCPVTEPAGGTPPGSPKAC